MSSMGSHLRLLARLAWRDSRHSRKRLAVSALSTVLGVAALVAIGSLADTLKTAVEAQTRTLLGADVEVSTRSPFDPGLSRGVDAVAARRSEEVLFTSMLVVPAKGGGAGGTRLVQVRALEAGFPFYGEFLTQPASAAASLQQGDFIVLEESLMAQFGLAPGDAVRLGKVSYRVAGALRKIPGESMAVAMLSPRVFIPRSSLDRTGLIGLGSLVRYKAHLALKPGAVPALVERELRQAGRAQQAHVETVEHRKRELGRAIENVDTFLGLVGYASMLLGAVGVGSAMHGYIRHKIATIAVLRCLGATVRQAFTIYLLQGAVLGLLGATVGTLLGLAAQALVPYLAGDLLPADVPWSPSWPAILRGAGGGLGFAVLFTLLPMLEVRKISPLQALRSAWSQEGPRVDLWRVGLGVVIGLSMLGFSVWQAGNLRLGLGLAAGIAVGLGLLAGAALLVSRAARHLCPRFLPFPIRQGIANLHRPENRTVLLMVALGLGVFLVVTVDFMRATLLGKVGSGLGGGKANLLFFDIQEDQIGPLRAVLAKAGSPVQVEAPIVTMKIASIKGIPVRELLRDRSGQAHGPSWALTREYRSTYRSELGPSEKIVAGVWVGRVAPEAEEAPISVEQGLARELGLALGDAVDFDVQGTPVKARVASLREVEWRRLEPNFFIVFPAGVLEAAPRFHVAAVKAATPADSARIQRAVVEQCPNVSAIDLSLVMQTVDGILGKVEAVVRLLALVTGGTGLLVLAGAMLAGRHQRQREGALLRTLGGTRWQLSVAQGTEHAVVGVLAALLGCALAAAANAVLANRVFRLSPAWPWETMVGAVFVAGALTLLVGWLANRGASKQTPLEVLRGE